MNRFLLFCLILIISYSCTVYKNYPIEVYTPGEIPIPPESKNAAIVYRNFKYKGDSLQHYYKDDFKLKKAHKDPVNLDSILVSICMNELAKNLKEQNTFNEIRIFPEIFEPHQGDKLPRLGFEMIRKITESTQSDLMISLETFSYFYSEYEQTAEMPTNSNEVITASVWAVYNPVNNKLVERKTMIDTIFWNRYDDEGNYQRRTKLPSRLTALKIASQLAGENYSKRFFASWQTVDRMYSVPPLPDFAAADEFLQKGEWDNAIMLWKRYTAASNGRMAINARYNLALAYEMKDDIDMAERWLDEALQIATDYKSREDLKMIMNYKKVLTKRKQQISRLNQM